MAAEFDGINVGYRDANKSAIYYEAVLDAAIEMVSTLCIASILWFAGLRRVGRPRRSRSRSLVTFTQYIRQFFEPVSLLSQRYTLLQSAMAGAERIFELLDEKDVAPPALAAERVLPRRAPPTRPSRSSTSTSSTSRASPSCATSASRRGGASGSRSSARRARARRRSRACSCASTSRRAAPSACSARTCAATSRTRSAALLGRPAGRVPVPGDGALERRDRRRRARPRAGRGGAAAHRGARALPATGPRGSGLDARVDERGQNFSAGERQLLAFARAIYRDAPLLVLDEATASVDSDTEARLQRALEAVMRRAGRRSSSRTASRPSARPTASSCSTRGASSRWGPTTSSSRGAACTRASTGCSSRTSRPSPPSAAHAEAHAAAPGAVTRRG